MEVASRFLFVWCRPGDLGGNSIGAGELGGGHGGTLELTAAILLALLSHNFVSP